MGQDSDVARVAAAMNAPGFKYRSFGNEPVRIRPGSAGTLAQPVTEAAPYVEDSLPPLPIPAAESLPPPVPYIPEPLVYDDTPSARYAYDDFPEAAPVLPEASMMSPMPDSAPMMAPMPQLAPMMTPAEPPPPEPPLFSWPESPANPPPLPTQVAPPAPSVAVGQPYAPAMRSEAAPVADGNFRLLESMGHRPGENAPPRMAEAPAGGTLGFVRRAAEGGGASNSSGMGMNLGFGGGAPLPPLSPSGHQSGLLPAAAVTVPLADVMRLIAAGATPPPSPFDAFRAALGAQPVR